MKPIALSREETTEMAEKLKAYLEDEFELEIGTLQGEVFVQFIAEHLGPGLYNRGLADAQAALARRVEDFAEDVYGLQQKVPRRR
ncbi:Uncharacterized conserved protein, DUF2164 family [Devosia enhydra]|uniref:Uncharacterized conserved protein, DUF2164 family n=1 Tax=Devosia enhydra TaxID=665118 RepID=A0A1K2HXM7_9HYPH|nr:DUF2164 domain-containing protein [Devosia enhydra]SFZ84224.1 Uncharacterized conserved protein, DUF2164 family [Devosia enhydra]